MTIGGPFGEWDELDFLAAGGMLVMAVSPSPIAVIAVMCSQWRGRLMARALPRALMITLYRYGRPCRRGVGEGNGGGTVFGADSTFTAAAGQATAPIVVTGAATLITDTTATLNGTVNPAGSATTYQFQYGLTTAYGSTTTAASAGSGFTAVPESASLTGLTLGTVYHFRVTATNAAGTSNGADATFTTSGGKPTSDGKPVKK